MSANAVVDWTVTKPGVVGGMPNEVYHADPVEGGSLSSTGARRILPPSCPAIFKAALDGEAAFDPTPAMLLGSGAHTLALGEGPEVVVIDADSYRTKAAQDAKADALAAGDVPLLPKEHEKAQAMAARLRDHPLAARLLNGSSGAPEQSAFWQDAETGVWCRARFDWLPDVVEGRRLIVPDYKTGTSAYPPKWVKSATDHGYHQQADFYLTALAALGIDADAAFVFLVQETAPPYPVTVVQLDDEAMRIGHHLNRQALRLYAHCRETDTWPAYSDAVEQVALPSYYTYQHREALTV